MALNQLQYERLMRFLDADMTLEEMEAFEKELAANSEMRQQLTFEQAARESLTKEKNAEPWFNQSNPYSTNGKVHAAPFKPLVQKKWLAFAVAASVLVIAATYMLFKNNTASPPLVIHSIDTGATQKTVVPQPVKTQPVDSSILLCLYKKYFIKDTLPDAHPMLLADALNGYDNGNYTALQKFDLSNLPQTRGSADENQEILQLAHYYKGIAFLETANDTKAIEHLQWMVGKSTDKNYKQKSRWYLALAYLKIGDKANAVEQLKRLTNTVNTYTTRAKKLMEKMSQINL